MFTGLIEEVGRVTRAERIANNIKITISAEKVLEDVKLGDSISIDGVCLTVIHFDERNFTVEATSHTLESTTLKEFTQGRRVNLERAMKLSDRLGGHLVQGHVDGVGKVSRVHYGEGSTELYLDLPVGLTKLMVSNGSVAVNGVSLTISGKLKRGIKLVIILATLEATTLGEIRPGSNVNIESDVVLRWITEQYAEGNSINTETTSFSGFGEIHLED